VGAVSDTVSVQELALVINTDSSTVGNVVDNKTVTELPLNGRNFLQLDLLVPGANQGVKGSQNQTQGGSISVNGVREQGNNFLLDGMDNNDLAINQYAVAISTEAIQEFKVQASTYSAEFGRSPGAQINIATKAGTNQLHGVLYEYLRNNDLDAKNFFDRPGPIPGYKRNQYGASIGGPIKKNKTFYFGNFEGARVRQGITKVATEPTLAMKNGDFSALPVAIYDPSSLHTVNGALVRSPFPGNIIPASQISTVGQNLVNLYPNPNTPGTSTANGLYTSSQRRLTTSTSSPSANAAGGTGNAIADRLLGAVDTASVSRSFAGINAATVAGLRQTSVNLFAKDDFRILPNLTLNVGFRWEYNAPTTDKYNHLATFDPTFPNSIPLPYLRISTPQTPNIYDSSKKEFSPRFGVAWTPFGPRTVIRGGYGLYWDVKLLNVILNSALTAPFLTGFNFSQSTNGIPNINLANPYGGTSGGPAIPGASWVENLFRDGYVQQWNFNIQHQLTESIGVTVGYVGSKGTHLDRAYDINEPAPTASFTQSLRKYPAYSTINVRSPSASSVYDALQVSFEKRLSYGLTDCHQISRTF
jgi:TonB-dependent Receptor Plug Domain